MRCIVVVIGLAMLLANPVAAYRDQIADHASWLQDVEGWNQDIAAQADGRMQVTMPTGGY